MTLLCSFLPLGAHLNPRVSLSSQAEFYFFSCSTSSFPTSTLPLLDIAPLFRGTMPVLDLSEFNIVLAVVGAFLILFGIISSKIKHSWYLGEALPATLVGILFGPIGAKFIDSARWGAAEPDQQHEITLVSFCLLPQRFIRC